jgi:hypothetical protein
MTGSGEPQRAQDDLENVGELANDICSPLASQCRFFSSTPIIVE